MAKEETPDDAAEAADAKPAKPSKARRPFGIATVAKPCLVGALLLTVVHAATGK